MSDTLLSKLVRLAHAKPELRKDLMPLIQKSATPRSNLYQSVLEAQRLYKNRESGKALSLLYKLKEYGIRD